MALPYSTQFIAKQGATSAATLIYVVPNDSVAIVRDANGYIETDPLTEGVAFLMNFVQGNTIWRFDAPAGGTTNAFFTGRQVFAGGQGFGIRITAGTWDWQVSGYLLKALPL